MIKEWLREFVAGGRTVFMTSHVLETVERLCDEAAIIKAGRLAWRGEVGQLASCGTIDSEGRQFDSLESLFLHIAGQQRGRLGWL
jgi:ABC-2 type transport system ATP-binding protein